MTIPVRVDETTHIQVGRIEVGSTGSVDPRGRDIVKWAILENLPWLQ